MQKQTFLLAIYLVWLHLALAVVLVKSDFIQRVAMKLGWSESKWRVEHYKQMLSYHHLVDTCVPDDAVLFIGDSFIQGMYVSGIVDRAVNFGIGGDTTDGVLRRLPMYASFQRARAIVVAVGYNDLRERDNSQIVNNYREILSNVPENIAVLCCSILPTDERCRRQRYNGRIIELNRSVAEICSLTGNCHFIDLAEKLRDTEGNLSDNYHVGDGIHLNSRGYRICNEILQTRLARVRGNDIR